MVPQKLPIATGDTIRFLRDGRWRFARVTKVGRKWLHVRLDDTTVRVPPDAATKWTPTRD